MEKAGEGGGSRVKGSCKGTKCRLGRHCWKVIARGSPRAGSRALPPVLWDKGIWDSRPQGFEESAYSVQGATAVVRQ